MSILKKLFDWPIYINTLVITICVGWISVACTSSGNHEFALVEQPPLQDSSWATLLVPLNEEGQAALPLLDPYSQSHTVELLELNQRELRSIHLEWEQINSQQSGAMTQELRDKNNEFYRAKINQLNAISREKLDLAAKSHQDIHFDYYELAAKIISETRQNPVANLASVKNYEQGGQIGFCFGRALLVHLLLRQAGVKQAHLAKIFNVGQLLVEKQLWQFHVAVMIRDSKAGYLVVDPMHSKPLAYQEWIAINSAYDIKGKYSRARFYITEARKFLPNYPDYSLTQLEDPALKPYFDDLFKSLNSHME